MMRSLKTRVAFRRAVGALITPTRPMNALFQAIESDDVQKVGSVVSSDKHLVETHDELTGETPIHAAAQKGEHQKSAVDAEATVDLLHSSHPQFYS